MFGWRLVVIGMIWMAPAGLWGQKRVDGRHLYERVLAIVPMTGSGTYADPRRPELTPATLAGTDQISGKGIISFSYQVSDDGKMAVVELVARDKSALEAWAVGVFASFFSGRSIERNSPQTPRADEEEQDEYR